MDTNEDEAKEHFKWMTEHAPEWEPQEPNRSRPKSINQLRSKDDLSDKYDQLARRFHELESKVKGEQVEPLVDCCRACGMMGHQKDGCFNAQVLV